MLQIVIGIDVDDLVERTELGVPEAPQFRVFFPKGQPLFIALFEFGHGAGAERIGADFIDHRRILQVTGVSEVIAGEPTTHPTPQGRERID
jgi:hypothetical protein